MYLHNGSHCARIQGETIEKSFVFTGIPFSRTGHGFDLSHIPQYSSGYDTTSLPSDDEQNCFRRRNLQNPLPEGSSDDSLYLILKKTLRITHYASDGGFIDARDAAAPTVDDLNHAILRAFTFRPQKNFLTFLLRGSRNEALRSVSQVGWSGWTDL